MSKADATYDVLISIRDKLDGLEKAVSGIKNLGRATDEVNQKTTLLGNTFRAVFGANLAERAMIGLMNAAKGAAVAQFSLASEIKDGAANLEMSARGYQVYSRLVKDSGADVGSLSMAINTLNRSLVEARDVTSAAAANFEQLGLDPAALEAMTVEKRMEAMAFAIAGAEDKLAAFRVAGQLMGERAVPRLRSALDDLAKYGYENLATAMDKAWMVMGDDDIARLDAQAKAIERKAHGLTVLESFGTGAGLGVMFGDAKLTPPMPPRGKDEASRLREQQLTLLQLRDAFEAAAKAEELFLGNPGKTDEEKRQRRIEYLQSEMDLLNQIIKLRKAMPLATGETRRARELELAELGNQYLALDNQLKGARGDSVPELQNLRDRVAGMNDRRRNPNALTAREGVDSGVLQWMEQVGSTGEQVAGVISEGIGGAIGSLSAKFAGNDVRSWGEVWKGILAGILQQLIQVQLQMLLVRALMGAFGGGSAPTGAGVAGPASLNSGFVPLGNAVPFTLPGRARGGDVEVGRLYRVNERNIEAFMPMVPGYISPGGVPLAGEGRGRNGAGAGGVVLNQTINVSTGVQETVRAEIMGMMPALGSASVDRLRDAIARNEIQL